MNKAIGITGVILFILLLFTDIFYGSLPFYLYIFAAVYVFQLLKIHIEDHHK